MSMMPSPSTQSLQEITAATLTTIRDPQQRADLFFAGLFEKTTYDGRLAYVLGMKDILESVLPYSPAAHGIHLSTRRLDPPSQTMAGWMPSADRLDRKQQELHAAASATNQSQFNPAWFFSTPDGRVVAFTDLTTLIHERLLAGRGTHDKIGFFGGLLVGQTFQPGEFLRKTPAEQIELSRRAAMSSGQFKLKPILAESNGVRVQNLLDQAQRAENEEAELQKLFTMSLIEGQLAALNSHLPENVLYRTEPIKSLDASFLLRCLPNARYLEYLKVKELVSAENYQWYLSEAQKQTNLDRLVNPIEGVPGPSGKIIPLQIPIPHAFISFLKPESRTLRAHLDQAPAHTGRLAFLSFLDVNVHDCKFKHEFYGSFLLCVRNILDHIPAYTLGMTPERAFSEFMLFLAERHLAKIFLLAETPSEENDFFGFTSLSADCLSALATETPEKVAFLLAKEYYLNFRDFMQLTLSSYPELARYYRLPNEQCIFDFNTKFRQLWQTFQPELCRLLAQSKAAWLSPAWDHEREKAIEKSQLTQLRRVLSEESEETLLVQDKVIECSADVSPDELLLVDMEVLMQPFETPTFSCTGRLYEPTTIMSLDQCPFSRVRYPVVVELRCMNQYEGLKQFAADKKLSSLTALSRDPFTGAIMREPGVYITTVRTIKRLQRENKFHPDLLSQLDHAYLADQSDDRPYVIIAESGSVNVDLLGVPRDHEFDSLKMFLNHDNAHRLKEVQDYLRSQVVTAVEITRPPREDTVELAAMTLSDRTILELTAQNESAHGAASAAGAGSGALATVEDISRLDAPAIVYAADSARLLQERADLKQSIGQYIAIALRIDYEACSPSVRQNITRSSGSRRLNNSEAHQLSQEVVTELQSFGFVASECQCEHMGSWEAGIRIDLHATHTPVEKINAYRHKYGLLPIAEGPPKLLNHCNQVAEALKAAGDSGQERLSYTIARSSDLNGVGQTVARQYMNALVDALQEFGVRVERQEHEQATNWQMDIQINLRYSDTRGMERFLSTHGDMVADRVRHQLR